MEALSQSLLNNSFALSAVEVAINSLYAKKGKVSLYQLWNDEASNERPVSSYTIGIDSIDKMVSKL
ncbi:MAG: hypothetical protein OXH57_03775 [Ekhidna sp.]|nr:hypothetical protein [Ekhidna sp.]